MAMELSQTSLHSRTPLAAIQYSGQHEGSAQADEILSHFARQLKQQGFRVGGVIRSSKRQPGAHPCDMDLEELTTGKAVSIFQQLGPGAQGCQLDTMALEHVVGMVDASIDRGIDVLFINKFGKREAGGAGFSATIAKAVSNSIPVLITLNKDYAGAWQNFCGGEGENPTADRASIVQWLNQSLPDAQVT